MIKMNNLGNLLEENSWNFWHFFFRQIFILNIMKMNIFRCFIFDLVATKHPIKKITWYINQMACYCLNIYLSFHLHASFTVTVPENSMLYIGYNNRKHPKAQVSKATAVITLNTMLGKLTWIHSPRSRERTYAWETERKDKRVGERESSEHSSINAVSDLFQTVMVAASFCMSVTAGQESVL